MSVGHDAPTAKEQIEAQRPSERWHGIHAVMVTPFQADLSIDEMGLRANVAFLARSDVAAVICLGSEGEF
jgi:dihydrodipicolinate synthase/N-acetylneuraminate lyase